jgi:hypothetical protein
LLRVRRKRPRRRRSAEKRDEFAPPHGLPTLNRAKKLAFNSTHQSRKLQPTKWAMLQFALPKASVADVADGSAIRVPPA